MWEYKFSVASPESQGVPSEAIQSYIDALEARGLPMHSLMLFRHGKLLAEGYWKPFGAARKHRLYSCSKSFVSIAIGFLADEGQLRLDDPIVRFFPEYIPPQGVHPYIAEARIRDLLRMASPHSGTAYEMTMTDWIEPFFTKPPTHRPGSTFAYDTSATHVLGTLVQNLTGKPFLDYLRTKFLNKLGFAEDAYCITDPMGNAWGGSGVVCTPRDFAKVALCCLNGGIYEGEQLIPAWYIKEATACQIDNYIQGRNPDMRQGYGYQFWRTRHNGFCFLGMGGQIALCLPDKDLLLVLTGDDQYLSDQYVVQFGAFWEKIHSRLKDEPLEANAVAQKALQARLETLAIPPLSGAYESKLTEKIHRQTYRMDENEMQISELRLNFCAEGGSLDYVKGGKSYTITFGYGKQAPQKFPECGYDAIVSGAWTMENTLNLCCYIIDDHCATLRISLTFLQDTVTVSMHKVAEGFLEGYEGIASGHMR